MRAIFCTNSVLINSLPRPKADREFQKALERAAAQPGFSPSWPGALQAGEGCFPPRVFADNAVKSVREVAPLLLQVCVNAFSE